MNIGVLGGSFNPPHLGHILLCFYAFACSDIERVIVVPCYKHPFGKKLIDFKHRLEMCRVAFEQFPGIRVSDIERKLGAVSKTIITLDALSRRYKNDRISLIIGSDIRRQLNKWYRIDELKKKYQMIVVPRGKRSTAMYIPDIKSSSIRDRISKQQGVSGYLTPSVLSYIKKKRLYAGDS